MAISKSRNWNVAKTAIMTLLCGLGHVLSSVVIGAIGIFIGSAINRLVAIESIRGDIAAWMLTAFGLVYMIWGIRAAARHHTRRPVGKTGFVKFFANGSQKL